MKSETLNLRVSKEFKRRLAKEAEKDKRSITNYIEAVLNESWRSQASGNARKERKSERSK